MSQPDAGFPVGTFPEAGQPDQSEGLDSSVLIESISKASSVSVDGQSVTERSISDLIALDNHLRTRNNKVPGAGWGSLGIAKAIPPDALGN